MTLVALVAVGIVLIVILLARISTLDRKLEQLRERVDVLGAGPQEASPPATAAPAPDPVQPAPPVATPEVAAPSPELQPTRPRVPILDFEQLVGGVWLQNIGAVLLLVGFFFLILWGYASGRFGPEVLVISGVLAGLGLVWRGAHVRLSAAGVGHALIGVGAGVVWLAIYLGHFRLNVLPPPAAFAFVIAASAFTGALGARYRAQLIAALGILGAHLPGLMKALMPMYGFSLPAGGLLAYLAGLNALVFALAARMGWSALALASLILTACTWALTVPDSSWSWSIEIGLAALFAGLGITPLLKLTRTDSPARPVDLAVIAVAPLALLAASTPMFQLAHPIHVAILLGSLAALYVAVAAWVDQRRPQRDLWRPLVAAAILFLTFAIERAVGPDRTALAWILEGCVLVLLGLRPRAQWLRWCGHVVVLIGGLRLLPEMLAGFSTHSMPLVNADAVTSGIAIAGLLFVAYRLLHPDRKLGLFERVSVNMWLVGAHILLMLWLARESGNLAFTLEGDGGAWRGERDIRAATGRQREYALLLSVIALFWMLQAAWLVRSGVRWGRIVPRFLGYGIALLVTLALVIVPTYADSWGRDLLPILHRDGLISLAAIAVAVATAAYLARHRESLLPIERRGAEGFAAAAALMLLTWISREADHVTRVMLDMPGGRSELWREVRPGLRMQVRAVAGTLTSVGWLLQAVIAFVVGWTRRSAFMRWMGIGLVAVTVLKFLIVDLAQADPFWRFLIAMLAGVAMLAVSYVYQRSGVGRRRSE